MSEFYCPYDYSFALEICEFNNDMAITYNNPRYAFISHVLCMEHMALEITTNENL